MSSSAAIPGRWLVGPATDLLLGCGVAYAAVFALQGLAGDALRAALPYGLMPLVALALATPHYGATILRVYERREDRRAYAFFALWTTLALIALFVWGLNSVVVGTWIVTVYLTWSPWHYAGQNYGVALLFLRRRGVEVSPLAKRLLHLSFWLSFGLVFLALHGVDPEVSYAPNSLVGSRYRLQPLGIPVAVREWGMLALGAAYLAATVGSFALLLRKARPSDLVPTATVVATQALWFSIPVVARDRAWLAGVEPLGLTHAEYAFLWVAMGHSIQYLWITSYFARRSGAATSTTRFYMKALAAGALVWAAPAILFAPELLGNLPYGAGLAFQVNALVNLHHFILDGAVWKLRDGRVARFLIRRDPAEPQDSATRGRWDWRLVGAAGAACVALAATTALLRHVGVDQALEKGDRRRALAAAEVLDRLGQEDPDIYLQVAVRDLAAGRVDEAERAVRAGLEGYPTAWLWATLGRVHDSRESWENAETAYLRALELDPQSGPAHYHFALHELRRQRYAKARRRLLDARRWIPRSPRLEPADRQRMLEVIEHNLAELGGG